MFPKRLVRNYIHNHDVHVSMHRSIIANGNQYDATI